MRTILKVINWNLCYFHWFKVGRLNVFLTSWTRKLISLLFLLVSGYGKCSSVGSSSSCSCSGTNPRLQRTVGRLLSFDWQDWRSGSHRSPGQVEAGKKILYRFFVPFFSTIHCTNLVFTSDYHKMIMQSSKFLCFEWEMLSCHWYAVLFDR